MFTYANKTVIFTKCALRRLEMVICRHHVSLHDHFNATMLLIFFYFVFQPSAARVNSAKLQANAGIFVRIKTQNKKMTLSVCCWVGFFSAVFVKDDEFTFKALV